MKTRIWSALAVIFLFVSLAGLEISGKEKRPDGTDYILRFLERGSEIIKRFYAEESSTQDIRFNPARTENRVCIWCDILRTGPIGEACGQSTDGQNLFSQTFEEKDLSCENFHETGSSMSPIYYIFLRLKAGLTCNCMDVMKLYGADVRNHNHEGLEKLGDGIDPAMAGRLISHTLCSPFAGIPSIAYYDPFIRKAARKYHMDPFFVKAVIWKESRFNHRALGKKGEIGLMQIMPGADCAAADWAQAHHCEIPSASELYNPELNLAVGCWYLARALKRYSGYKNAAALALCEYNAGASRAADWTPESLDEPVIDRISIPATRNYVKDILKQYNDYKKHEFTHIWKGFR